MSRARELRAELKRLLTPQSGDWQANLAALDAFEPVSLIGPLFSFLPRADILRWRTITALGLTAKRMLAGDLSSRPEDARVVMRRLIWNLNEESGNVAWGAPEAMGEIMAVNPKLAEEYHTILISYVDDCLKASNFLDHPPLRRGVFWGIARLAQAHPAYAAKGCSHLLWALKGGDDPDSPEPEAYACLTLARMGSTHTPPDTRAKALAALTPLATDTRALQLYRDRELLDTSMAELAKEAAAALG